MRLKVVDADKLDNDITGIANVIRSKTGETNELDWPEDFAAAIEAIDASKVQVVNSVSGTARTLQIPYTGAAPEHIWVIGYADPTMTSRVCAIMCTGNTAQLIYQTINGTVYGECSVTRYTDAILFEEPGTQKHYNFATTAYNAIMW